MPLTPLGVVDTADRSKPALNAAVRTAIDLDLFSLTNTSVTVEEAAKKTEVDGVLMCMLSSTH